MTTQAIKTVSSTPTLLSPSATHSGVDITIQHLGSSGNVFIGDANVSTTSYGFKLLAGTAVSFALRGRDELYAVSENGTQVAVLTLGLV